MKKESDGELRGYEPTQQGQVQVTGDAGAAISEVCYDNSSVSVSTFRNKSSNRAADFLSVAYVGRVSSSVWQ